MSSGMDVLAFAVALLLADHPLGAAEAERSVAITVPELKAHVYRLASPEFLGRRGPGAARTARHLAAAFERLGLQPAFGGSYFQPIPWPFGKDGGFVGRNVVAVLPGTDPRLGDEWVLLGAHYDHLGREGNHLFPGADDNASGVAMLLEVAERFALQPEKPRRTLVFASFDLEESGLLGSNHFARHPPRDFAKLKAVLIADMLGRSMANVMDEFVFALGSETAPELRHLVEKVPPPDGLQVGRLGADLIGTRSDYGPFRNRGVPFLFFSTGQHSDYHRPTDLPDRIDYDKLRWISVWIADLLGRLAGDDRAPTWDHHDQPPDLEEARTVLMLLTRVLDRPQSCPLSPTQREAVRGIRERLAAIVQRGTVTGDERTWLIGCARLLLVAVF